MTNMLKDIFQHPANEKQLDFSIHFMPDTPQWLLGDEDRIKQIFVNLIGNAIKFTQQGFVSVTIGWQDDALKFMVRDSGCGIPKKKSRRCSNHLLRLIIPVTGNTKDRLGWLFVEACRANERLD